MGLFDMTPLGGLFGNGIVADPNKANPLLNWDWRKGGMPMPPSMNLQADPETQGAIDSYAAMPTQPEPQKRGGLFGSGYGGEDIMSMLLRAAAIAQGDYGAASQFGGNIGRRAREAAAEAAKRQAELADYEEKKRIDQRYSTPEATTMYRQYKEAGYSEEQIRELMQKDLAAGRTKYFPLQEGGSLAAVEPGAPPRMVIQPNPGEQSLGAPAGGNMGGPPPGAINALRNNPALAPDFDAKYGQGAAARAMGGGVGNGTGGFRP